MDTSYKAKPPSSTATPVVVKAGAASSSASGSAVVKVAVGISGDPTMRQMGAHQDQLMLNAENALHKAYIYYGINV